MVKKKTDETFFSSTTVKSGPVNYPEAFQLQLKADTDAQSVYILPPFRKFKDYIFLGSFLFRLKYIS